MGECPDRGGSSIGQSGRLIICWFQVQVLAAPPRGPARSCSVGTVRRRVGEELGNANPPRRHPARGACLAHEDLVRRRVTPFGAITAAQRPILPGRATTREGASVNAGVYAGIWRAITAPCVSSVSPPVQVGQREPDVLTGVVLASDTAVPVFLTTPDVEQLVDEPHPATVPRDMEFEWSLEQHPQVPPRDRQARPAADTRARDETLPPIRCGSTQLRSASP